MISIQLNETVATPGSRVTGSAVWQPDRPVNAREVRVSAEWRTEGRGTESSGKTLELHFPAPTDGMPLHMPFDIQLPADGPLSYDGKLIRIIWELVVRVDLPWASDEVMRQPFRVVARQL